MSEEGSDPLPIGVAGELLQDLSRGDVKTGGLLARRVGMGTIVVGTVLTLAWGFYAWRIMDRFEERFGGFVSSGDSGPTLGDRLEVLVQSLSLLALGVITLATGAGLRLFAAYAASRTGANLTGIDINQVIEEQAVQEVPVHELDED